MHGSGFVRGAAIGGVGAAFVIAVSSALAGTGVNGVFNLGETNSVDQQTILSGATPNGTGESQLQVTDTLAAGAPAVGAQNQSSAPTVRMQNKGGGSAAQFIVGAAKAPFTVSNKNKVVNLNADLLDGIDSTGFTQGAGHFYSNRGAALEASTPNVDQALVIPNLGELDIYCGNTGYAVKFLNSSGVLLDVVSTVALAPDAVPPGTSSDPHLARQLLANGGNDTLVTNTTGLVDGTITVGKDTGPTQLLGTIHFTGELDSNVCTSQAQGWTT